MTREEKIEALKRVDVVMVEDATDEEVNRAFKLNFYMSHIIYFIHIK